MTENPAWLSELIPAMAGRYYVPYPPMPALVLVPFIVLFGQNFQQQILAHMLGAGIVIGSIGIALKIKKDNRLAVYVGLLSGLSTILWYMASVGSSWYLGQITAYFFLTVAIYEGLSKKRLWLVSILIGAAYLSRVHTILLLPFFLFLMREKLRNFKEIFIFLGPMFGFFVFNCLYNYIRFGAIWDKGYVLIPGVLEERYFDHGIMSLYYIRRNLETALWSFPKIIDKFPYIIPSWNGLAIWITTPAFIFAFWARLKEKINVFAWVGILVVFGFVLMHGTNGFSQFGYRFAMDFYPFLVFLTIKGITRTGLKWYHWIFLFLGILVNLWGVVWINKMGWVEF